MRHYQGERCHLNGAVAAKEPIKFGGIGPGGTASDIPRILHAALGLPIRVIMVIRVPQISDWRPKAVNWRQAV
jgi:hypothetical protein